jgi:uncharacterized protein (DUF1499 family)
MLQTRQQLASHCDSVSIQSPLMGFVDDVEFYFPADNPNTVEYR